MDFEEHEKLANEIRKENEKYLDLFEQSLINAGLVKKTIRKHMNNIDFYLNDFLTYYEPVKMEDGCCRVDDFLGDWFIRKAMWATKDSINSNCASLKKFYKLMLDYGYIKAEDYKELLLTIKENKQSWIDCLEAFDDGDEYWFMNF
ncbi:MAG: hypothetical protein LUH02_02730 [Erysipelotrichaceae bacterium]|nr:hypothetical protein [Erysipelotrichaceae bacterium]